MGDLLEYLFKHRRGQSLSLSIVTTTMVGIDQWKRERLIRAGADLIIPDFTCLEELEKYLFGA